MNHQICDACECVSHCTKSGCIPIQPLPASYKAAVDASGEECALVDTVESRIAATAPDHIWLDLGEELHLVGDNTTFRDLGGVTWSEDNATGVGIKYVRVGALAQISKEQQ